MLSFQMGFVLCLKSKQKKPVCLSINTYPVDFQPQFEVLRCKLEPTLRVSRILIFRSASRSELLIFRDNAVGYGLNAGINL